MNLKRCWPMAMMMLASQAAFAVGAPVISSTASFGNLNYRLIDLDANDGITAAVTFAPQASLQLTVSDTVYNNAGQFVSTIEQKTDSKIGVPFSSGLSVSKALVDGRASGTSTTADGSGTASYDAAYLSAFVAGTAPGQFSRRGAATYSALALGMTLTANTRIEFFADVDLTNLIDVTAAQAYATNSGLDLYSVASIFGSLYGVGGYGLSADAPFSTPLSSQEVSLNLGGSIVRNVSSDPARNSDLFLSLTNSTGASQDANLNLSLSNQISVMLSPQLAVPEMGTNAMFGLGLLGVVAASLGQRQRRVSPR